MGMNQFKILGKKWSEVGIECTRCLYTYGHIYSQYLFKTSNMSDTLHVMSLFLLSQDHLFKSLVFW